MPRAKSEDSMTPSEKKARADIVSEIIHESKKYEDGFISSDQFSGFLNESLDAAERRGFERAKELVASLILNDGYAITFQTMGQYRTAIAKNIRSLTHDEA